MATEEEYRNSMLANIPDDYDKTTGSFIYDALAPIAIELGNMFQKLEEAKGKLVIDNLSGDELDQRIKERTGITRKQAVKATGTVIVSGNGTVSVGDVFMTEDGVQFQATETKTVSGNATINISAVMPGVNGNVPANQITLIPVTIQGVTSVNNPNATAGGIEPETDESLISRYYLTIQEQPSTGNPAYFRFLAREVNGIADARVFRAWNGPGTVKVVLLGEEKRSPGATVINAVNTLIKSNEPIDANVTVVGVSEVMINVSVSLSLRTGAVISEVIEEIKGLVKDYLKSLAFTDLVVRITKIGEVILNADGVIDYTNLKINNGSGNIELKQDEVPVMGAVVIK
ncbi:baseplate J/gp47 family protein [Paenibacillus sp. NPDC093718]|uniref:baseplate J/gp47 family protein n=1 Tax=Paenibacillus sp. NPDC093718 TaxID=3390601 RepID=UPI003D016B38